MPPLFSSTARMVRLSLPIAFRRALGVLAPVFSRPGWPPVTGLRTGAVLAPGPRTRPAMRRRLGRRAAPDVPTSHGRLHRARWSPLTARRRLRRRRATSPLALEGAPTTALDGTARRRQRPTAARWHPAPYSSKQKTHSDKNWRLVHETTR